MEEEEAIKRITRLLEMGGTMLATHHDCGAPLFRYKGEVICPVCSFMEAGAPQVPSQAENFAVESEGRPSSKSRPILTAETEGVSAVEFEGRRGIEQTLPPETRDNSEIAHREAVSGKTGSKDEVDLAKEELQRAILQKIREISEKMRDEQDLGRLKSQLEYIKEALKVLGRLRD
ncbi:MAG TPA: hypothetical protein HA349_08585 [Methanotrichaceae archaeon]|nr:hypothetical protein [Methanotrichaceae archaeon]